MRFINIFFILLILFSSSIKTNADFWKDLVEWGTTPDPSEKQHDPDIEYRSRYGVSQNEYREYTSRIPNFAISHSISRKLNKKSNGNNTYFSELRNTGDVMRNEVFAYDYQNAEKTLTRLIGYAEKAEAECKETPNDSPNTTCGPCESYEKLIINSKSLQNQLKNGPINSFDDRKRLIDLTNQIYMSL